MRPPSRIARWLGAGPSDTPRAVEVRRVAGPVARALVQVAGAPLVVVDDGWDGDVGRVLLACARAGVGVDVRLPDVARPAPRLALHGREVDADEALAWVWGRR